MTLPILVFIGILAQLVFRQEWNVSIANWLSLPMILWGLRDVYKHGFVISRHFIVWGLFLMVFSVSMLWHPNPSMIRTDALNLILVAPLLCLLITNNFIHDNRVRIAFYLAHVFWLLFVLGLFVSDSENIYLIGFPEDGRFAGTFTNSNGFIAVILLACYYSLFPQVQTNKYLRIIGSILTLPAGILVIAAGSKKGVLLYLAFLIYYMFTISGSLLKKALFILILFSISVLIFTTNAIDNQKMSDQFDFLLKRIDDSSIQETSELGSSTAIRKYFVEKGLEGFTNSPVLGNGFDAFSYKYRMYAHNNYVEILYDYGIVGFILFYLVLAILLWDGLLLNKRIKIPFYVLILCITINDFTVVTYYNKFAMFSYAWLISLVISPKKNIGK